METPRFAAPSTNGLAVASLVLSILSLLTCGGFLLGPLLGLLFGAIALGQIANSQGRQTGQVQAAIGLSLSVVAFLMLPIVAGILFPVFAKAREKARQADCSANQRQLALAALMYVQDYDQQLPRADAAWTELLEPYLKHPAVYECAADVDGPPSYHFNPALRSLELVAVTNPSEAILFFESDDEKTIAWRHNDGANFAYVDGHVTWLSQQNNPTRAAPATP